MSSQNDAKWLTRCGHSHQDPESAERLFNYEKVCRELPPDVVGAPSARWVRINSPLDLVNNPSLLDGAIQGGTASAPTQPDRDLDPDPNPDPNLDPDLDSRRQT